MALGTATPPRCGSRQGSPHHAQLLLRPWPWDARGHAGGAEQAANPRGKRRDVVVRVFPSLSSMAFHGIFDFSMAMLNNQRKKQSD